MDIIPAIDIINGQCVRLSQGDYDNCKIYHSNPLEVAKMFEGVGIKRLHLVDLDGAKSGCIKNLKILERIASNTSLKIDFSGGVKSKENLEAALQAGATYVGIGSLAQQTPSLVKEWMQIHRGQIILGADVWSEKIAIMGWKQQTETTIYQFIDYFKGELGYLVCTDIAKDGMMQGPSVALYKKLLKAYPDLKLIASGGVSNLEDLVQLREMGASGVIVGKAIYENSITLKDLELWMMK